MTHPKVYNIIALKERIKQLEDTVGSQFIEIESYKAENLKLKQAIDEIDKICITTQPFKSVKIGDIIKALKND